MIMEFTNTEAEFFMNLGYSMGFMMDVQVGDQIAIPPVTRTEFDGTTVPFQTLRVTRLIRGKGSVISFVAIDNVTDLETNKSYGDTYPCFIKKPSSNRRKLEVWVDLDPMPGAFHSVDSARNIIGGILNESIGHYNPMVSVG